MEREEFYLKKEIFHNFAIYFNLNSRIWPLWLDEAEGPRQEVEIITQRGYDAFKKFFIDSDAPIGDLDRCVSPRHILSFIKHRLINTNHNIAIRIFFLCCALSFGHDDSSETIKKVVKDVAEFNSIAALNYEPSYESPIDVDTYNARDPNTTSHTLVYLSYTTRSGMETTICCCPQCGSTGLCERTETIHKGKLILARNSRQAALRTQDVAMFDCCGKIVASVGVTGIVFNYEGLKKCSDGSP